MKGCDLFAVGQILGHKTPRMTQRYAHLSPQYMVAAVSKLDRVFGEVMPGTVPAGSELVPVASPQIGGRIATPSNLLN